MTNTNQQVLDFSISAYAAGDVNAPKFALMLPGLLDSKDYPHMHSHVDFLAAHGYLAMAIDMPGTWESGGDIHDFTVTNCLKTIAELIAQHDRPTIIVGHSNGGRLGLHAAAQDDRVKAVVAVMAPLHVYRGSEKTEEMRQWRRSGIKISTRVLPDDPERERQYELPYAFVQDSAKYDLHRVLPKLVVPKLFIAAKRDGIIPVSEVKKAYEISMPPKEFHVVDSGHNYRKVPAVIDEVNVLIKDFLQARNLL